MVRRRASLLGLALLLVGSSCDAEGEQPLPPLYDAGPLSRGDNSDDTAPALDEAPITLTADAGPPADLGPGAGPGAAAEEAREGAPEDERNTAAGGFSGGERSPPTDAKSRPVAADGALTAADGALEGARTPSEGATRDDAKPFADEPAGDEDPLAPDGEGQRGDEAPVSDGDGPVFDDGRPAAGDGGAGAAGPPSRAVDPRLVYPPDARAYLSPPPMPVFGVEGVAALTAGYTTVVMKNVALRLDDEVNVFVESLEGILVPLGGGFVDLDRPSSFQVVVDEAVVWVSEEDLTLLFDRYLFDDDDDDSDDDDDDDFGGFRDEGDGMGPQLRDPRASLERGRLVVKGRNEDGDDVQIDGYLEPTPSGDVALLPTALERDDKPVEELADVFDDVASLGGGGFGNAGFGGDFGGAGFRAADFGATGFGPLGFGGSLSEPVVFEPGAILFDPEAILSSPELRADVVDVKIERGRVRLLLEGPAPEVKDLGPGGDVENFAQLRGGALRMGKLAMERADVVFVDADPGDLFDLSLRKYDRQVVAGQTEVRADLGLTIAMPDFDELKDDDEAEVEKLGDDDESDAGDQDDEDHDESDDESDDEGADKAERDEDELFGDL